MHEMDMLISIHLETTHAHMMKLLLVALALVVAVAWARPEDEYTTKYDNIDLDEILTKERLYNKYYDCLRNKGKCTPDGQELKDNIPDALATACKKCNKKQQDGIDKVFRYLSEKKPEHLKELMAIYDPDNTYFEKYKDEAKKRGIIIP